MTEPLHWQRDYSYSATIGFSADVEGVSCTLTQTGTGHWALVVHCESTQHDYLDEKAEPGAAKVWATRAALKLFIQEQRTVVREHRRVLLANEKKLTRVKKQYAALTGGR